MMFASAKPVVLAGAVITLIAVSGVPAVTAIGIVNGTFLSTPKYWPDGQVGTAAAAGAIPISPVNKIVLIRTATRRPAFLETINRRMTLPRLDMRIP